MLIAITSLIG